MTSTYATIRTAIAPFTAVVDEDGAVLASGWTADIETLLPVIHPALRPVEVVEGDIGDVADAIVRYHDGDLSVIDTVRVRQRSGPFTEHAWDVLRTVPAGAPVTYTEYAAKVGSPGGRARCGVGVREERDRAVRPLPPGAGHRRHHARLPLGHRRQDGAAGARVGRPLTPRVRFPTNGTFVGKVAYESAVRCRVGSRESARTAVRPFTASWRFPRRA